ncbi:MAG TPA: hypothetical protein VGL78_15125 [Solirubrobacteraceae bacterium]|jgi:hypothetical protein
MSDAAAFITAIATLGLAAATYKLARDTRDVARSGQQAANAAMQELALLDKQTEATKRQSEVAEQAFRASVKPVLAPTGYAGGNITPDGELLVIEVENIGTGIARVVSARVAFSYARRVDAKAADFERSGGEWPGQPVAPIPAGKNARVLFVFETQPEGTAFLAGNGDLFVWITYTDYAGQQEASTLCLLRRVKPQRDKDTDPRVKELACAMLEVDVPYGFVADG